jgi:endonuclease YncB( thermonuclease family)
MKIHSQYRALLFTFALIFSVHSLLGCLGENRESRLAGAPHNPLVTPGLQPGEVPKLGTIASVRVSKVFDGDTFEFVHEGVRYSVRLSGVDAPERNQEYADQARKALRKWTEAVPVRIEVLKIDPYKRLVCKVFLESSQASQDLSLRLLEDGLAWHFKRYVKDQTLEDRRLYSQAEDRARENNLGLWSKSQPLAPWTFREQERAVKTKGLAPGL